ncbi:hypothetical protein [Streptomyces osmaniensis]|uniref:Uncharacterized protein n=1 Tax=Streptomyces osmaniensis TaxID=593134 RepID=A0ABP6YW53_9ACTN
MALMTHARNQAHTADYTQLSPTVQAVIDKALTDADAADTGKDYVKAMGYVATAAGIQLPTSKDLAVCSCLNDADGCGCGAIFDTALTGVVVTATSDPDCNLSRLQCPTCGHDHPRPAA